MFQAEKWPPAHILVKILSYPTTQVFLRKVQKVSIWIIHAFVILDLKQSGGYVLRGTNFLLENIKKKNYYILQYVNNCMDFFIIL